MPAGALATDLYQLTMMAGYVAAGRHLSTTATFELFVRRLPPRRAFLVAAGLSSLLDYFEQLRFDAGEIRALREEPALSRVQPAFFEYLRDFQFRADVLAVPEGTPVFASEPILRVTGSIAEAQLVETAALALLNFQTSVASKAIRVVHAARGRPVMEFGARRAHGLEAALLAARAAFIAGCASTSFVEAGVRFGIPLSGTMAHSWVQSEDDELSAFRRYSEVYGDRSVLLLDTYDTVAAAKQIVDAGLRPDAVRLDSGDLLGLSRDVRAVFDAAGMSGTRIVASGDLDEDSIDRLLTSGAPIDAFGVGTSVVTSLDAPALGGVYKLVELVEDGRVRRVRKTSPGKATWPGRKQIWRVVHDGTAAFDVIAFEEEPAPAGGVRLLRPVMRAGQRISADPPLGDVREWCRTRVAELPAAVREIHGATSYDVRQSDALRAQTETSPQT